MHEVLGRSVQLPVEVRDASAGTATFLASARAVAPLLPPGLAPARVSPVHTLVTLVMVDYRDNDLGDYDEAAIQLTVTRRGFSARVHTVAQALRGSPQTFTWAMPVNQEFTLHAGREIWGFPKTLDDVSVQVVDGSRATCHWSADGQQVWRLTVPVGRERRMPAPPLTAWTVLDGGLHRTRFRMQAEHGRLGSGAGVELHLGGHPTADVLRSLGLPRRALFSTWMDDLTASFAAPEPA